MAPATATRAAPPPPGAEEAAARRLQVTRKGQNAPRSGAKPCGRKLIINK